MKDLFSGLILPMLLNKFLGKNNPFFFTFIVTWRCNARCVMCDVWKKSSMEELSIEQLLNIFRKIHMVRVVRLTGGEPFLRKDLVQIVDGIAKNTSAQIIHITTNGLLTDSLIDFVKHVQCKNIHIKISLNGIDENYNRIMGVPNAYKRVIKTIENLKKLQGRYSFFMGINQTITDWDAYEDSKKIRKLCAEYRMPYLPVIAYKPVALYDIMSEKKDEQKSFIPFGDFSKDNLKIILNDFIKKNNQIQNFLERLVKRYYLTGLYNRLLLNNDKPNPKCVALRNHIRILPNGDIPICLYNSKVVGNLDKECLKTVYDSIKVKKGRIWVDCCKGCWAECEVIPNAIFSPQSMFHLLSFLH